MKILLILPAVLLFATANGQGQEYQEKNNRFHDNVVVYQDSRIDSLIQDLTALNKKFPEIEGYRVMIFFDAGNNSKDTAYRVMKTFEEEYPDVPAYVSFHPPYYRVRVGDFRSEMEAKRFLNRIKYDYPNGWVVKTSISLPKLD
ncbi:MAG: SPOR domain-containing protein [Bacteroidales bacterium]|nr:SPOR domain-containing protein [Bacteroidales bacterium]